MSGVSKIYYKDQEILYVDYRGMKEEEMIQSVHEAERIVYSDGGKPHLHLTNITDCSITSAFMSVAKAYGKKTSDITIKAAIVGIVGIQFVMLRSYNLFLGGKMKPFTSEEEAKEYLIN